MEPDAQHDHRGGDGSRFDLAAGALCLDFVNTWGDRARPESDRLRSYGDLLAFAAQAGLSATRETAEARRRAARRPSDAGAALASARELRDTLYGLFSARAAGRPAPRSDLARLNSTLGEALAELRVAPGKAGYRWAWEAPADPCAATLRPIARSAAELLVSPDLARVRECHGAGCTWLFLDSSRNRSRRWCSMEGCGNRAKARRHYRRLRSAEP